MGRRYGLTNAEANAAAKKHSEPCPLSSCGSKKTYVVGLSFGGYSGCHDCGHKWGWHNAAGTSVSRAKFEERAEKDRNEWAAKAARSRRLEAPGEGTEMAAKKTRSGKGARGAKAKSKKTGDGAPRKTFASVIKGMLEKNPKVTDEAVVAACRKAFPDAAKPREAKDVQWYRAKLGIKNPAKKAPAKAKKTKKK
jgi:hypothetical protein